MTMMKPIVRIKQLPLKEGDKQKLIKFRMGLFFDASDSLAAELYTGEISIGQWQEAMKTLIREAHASAAAIGKGGWDQMTWADWGRLGTPMREQYQYLQGFAQYIDENRDKLSLRAIQARARLYGEGAGGSAVLMQAGAVWEELLPWIPRDGSTRCLNRCHCGWRLVTISRSKTAKIVRATWHLGEAEHCEDCVPRDGHTEIVTVDRDAEVPAVIGFM